jgi:hypothetical protein
MHLNGSAVFLSSQFSYLDYNKLVGVEVSTRPAPSDLSNSTQGDSIDDRND